MINEIKVSGDHSQIGHQHGTLASEQIHSAIEIYKYLLAQLPGDLINEARPHIESMKTVVENLTPHLAEEISSIAAGAGVEEYWIYLLNCRSELLSLAIPECTSICSPESSFMGQNWDYIPELQPLTLLAHITLPTDLKIVTLTEPGMVGKIGLNSAGIGVCLNLLTVKQDKLGLPIHVLLRWLLEATSRKEVDDRLSQVQNGIVGNVLIGSKFGWGINMEYLGDHVVRTDFDDETFVHTNHPVAETTGADDFFANSKARFDRAKDLCAGPRPAYFSDIDALLSDQAHRDFPILAPAKSMDGFKFGTLYSVIMDLKCFQLWLRAGSKPSNFKKMRLGEMQRTHA